jgi:EAL domain-containing protein (putative c-di-GMP-specific phosphodiesterase class I)
MTAALITSQPVPVGPASHQAVPVPLCFVLDEESSMRHFLSLVLHGLSIDAEEFADGAALRAALERRQPDLVFINISLESADAIDCVVALGKYGFTGPVQLMSGRGGAVLEHVKSIGVQNRLRMLPVLKKPFETEAIVRVVQDLQLGTTVASNVKAKLDEALDQTWVEFWYQPKIELRRKKLAGAEAYARIRHPQHGILSPASFMPDASEGSILRLAELAVTSALRAGKSFAELGLQLPIAVNIPVPALIPLPLDEMIRAHHAPGAKWAGLIIDVTEEQILTDLSLAAELTRRMAGLNVKLAIDDFGRGLSSLSRLQNMPFAELKLDRNYVTDCGTDKVKAPLCKTVIDLAHNFGSVTVAVGIEKAADALALVSMGCDYGQGFLLGQPMAEERFVSLLRQRAAHQGATLDKGAARQKRRA